MRQGLVLLSDQDTDAPALPAIATVSKYDSWPGADGGAWSLGRLAAVGGATWLDRPYWTGNPSPDWLAEKVKRNAAAGGLTQIGNEQNLPLEGWAGGPSALFALHAATVALLTPDEAATVIAAPPSPGVPGWQAWVNYAAGKHAVHCYGSDAQMREIVQWFLDSTDADLYITELNPGAGNTFDLNAWANNDLRSFLTWCQTEPRIKVVAYFAWEWDESANLPSSVDAKGTDVVTVLSDALWTDSDTSTPVVAPDTTPVPISRPSPNVPPVQERGMQFVDQRGNLPVLTGSWPTMAYHDRPLIGIEGCTIHYTAGPVGQSIRQIAEYQISNQAIAQTGAGQPFPAIAYTLAVDEFGVVHICHDINKRTWHSGAVVDGRARNATHIGIVYTGKVRPNSEQVIGIATAIDWCEKQLGRELLYEGHMDAMATSCPGPDWPDWRVDIDRELARLLGGSLEDQKVDQLRTETWDQLDVFQNLGAKWRSAGWPSMAVGMESLAESGKSLVRSSKGER